MIFAKQFTEDGYCFLKFEIVRFFWTNAALQLLVLPGPRSLRKESNSFLPRDTSCYKVDLLLDHGTIH
ncbi:hypothetical protein ACTXT7_016547 [Hymenolepis weldensis]